MDHLPLSIKCPNCASALREADYDLERGMVKCGYCGSLMIPPKAQTGVHGLRQRPPVAMPFGMEIEKTAEGLLITRRWFHVLGVLLMPCAVVWLIFAVKLANFRAPVIWVEELFSWVNVGVGFGIGYYALALLLNRSWLEVTLGTVTVKHGPLPWLGYRQIIAGMIDQLYCKEIIRRNENGPSLSYEVWVAQIDSRHSRLVAVGMEPEQALYIEQQIEALLDLKDRPMPGEFRR